MGFKSIFIATIVLVTSSNVHSATITNEDFTSGATGWSRNQTTSTYNGNRILGGYNAFGAGARAVKEYSISAGVSQIDIEFDFYRIDSWDNERFIVAINNITQINDVYSMSPAIGNIAGAGYPDHIVHYSLSLAVDSTSLRLDFSSSLNQSPSDESWGIDNLVITQTMSPVPVPAAAWLFGSGLIGLVGLARRRNNA